MVLLLAPAGQAQSPEYQQQKADKIAAGSVFTKIIKRELPAEIVYEDEEVIAFVPLRLQTPVHFLIVPKKEIHTVNDATEEDGVGQTLSGGCKTGQGTRDLRNGLPPLGQCE